MLRIRGVYFFIALRNLMQARQRTILLGAALTLVTILFVMLRATATSVSANMIEVATTLNAGHVNIGGFYKFRRKSNSALVIDREKLRQLAQEIVPEAELIIDRQRGWGRLIGPKSSINVGLYGLEMSEEQNFVKALSLAKEIDYRTGGSTERVGDIEALAVHNSVLIFTGQAKKLGVTVGDSLTLVSEASGGQTNTLDLKVTAIAEDFGFMSNWSVFVPRSSIIELYQIEADTTGHILIYLKDIQKSAIVMERLRSALAEKGYLIMDHDPQAFWMKFDKVAGEDWLGQKLDLTIWSDEISFITWITTAFDLVSGFLVAVLALIIGGGIGNTMWLAVKERTKDIGTMRAIGVQRHEIAFLFLMEAGLIGFVFSTIGVVVGAILVMIVNGLQIPISIEALRMFLMTNQLHLNLDALQLLYTILLFTVVTSLAAIFPARGASQLSPVEAFGHSK